MTAQTGPRLTITGTCEGCEHCRVHNGALRCMGTKERRALTGLRLRAPAWCPELPAARLALARSMVTEGPFPHAGDAWFDAWAQSRGDGERHRVAPSSLACSDCGDLLADPSTADECSIEHGPVAK